MVGAQALSMKRKPVKAVVMCCDPVRKRDKALQTEKVHTQIDLEAPSKETIYYSFLLFGKENLFSKSFFVRQQD